MSFLRLLIIVASALHLADVSAQYAGISFSFYSPPGIWIAGGTAFAYHYNDPYQWIRRSAWLSGIVAMVSFWWLEPGQQGIALGAGLVWMAYLWAFRSFWWLKPVLVAAVWVFSTHLMVIPVASAGPLAGLGMVRFLFIAALALGYDIIDQNYDREQSTNTLALHLGSTKALILAGLALLMATILCWNMSAFTGSVWKNTGVFLVSFALIVWIQKNSSPMPWKKAIWYKIFIDTLMLFI